MTAALSVPLDCYLAFINPTRAGFFESPTPAEKEAVAAHFHYLQDLCSRGIVRFAGRATNGFCGIGVFTAESAAAARQLMDNDPAARAGVFMISVHPFRLALAAPTTD